MATNEPRRPTMGDGLSRCMCCDSRHFFVRAWRRQAERVIECLDCGCWTERCEPGLPIQVYVSPSRKDAQCARMVVR